MVQTYRLWWSVALCLMACTGGDQDAADHRVVVHFWQFWKPEVIQPVIQRFELEHPDVRVEVQQLTWKSGLQKIEAALAAGTGPDVCELGSTWMPRFAEAGVLADLTDDARPLREVLQKWEVATFDGSTYGFPWLLGTRALYYNRELFRRAGLSPEHAPETWEELLEAAKRVHALDQAIYGFGINAGERYILYKKFMPFAWGNGARLVSDDGARAALDSRAMVEALDFYTSLTDYALLEKQDVLDQAFQDGILGMQVSGAWNLESLPQNAPELDFSVALVPKPTPFHGTHASFAGGEVLVVMAKTRVRQAAVDLARFLVDRPNATLVARQVKSVQPAARGAAADPYYQARPLEQLFVKQLETAVAPPAHPSWIRIEELLNTAIERAVLGDAAPEEALWDASRQVQALLN